MNDCVKTFGELPAELYSFAGGKGSILSKMYQSGYPVPEGFVILPSAFQDGQFRHQAREAVDQYVNSIRSRHASALFAVRSSALSEDSAQASFAGEFDTVLNVKTDQDMFRAIDEVRRSAQSERVKAYSAVQGVEDEHEIAIVIQLMIPSEISGVLFTADPITGSRREMTGNYVYGLGEQLVSGEADAYSFKLARPKKKYDGPGEFRKYASKLYKLAKKLEKDLGGPQDIEWAAAGGTLYILQSRPITTLQAGNLETYEWNDSFSGDFLWTNTNIGEAIPDVMTPLTWSLLRNLDEESGIIPGYYVWSGNICGRAYNNMSQPLSVLAAFGLNPKGGKIGKMMSDTLGEIPAEMKIPLYPFSKYELLKIIPKKLKPYLSKMKQAKKNMSSYLDESPEWCRNIEEKLKRAETERALLAIWNNEIYPYLCNAWFALISGGRDSAQSSSSLTSQLTKLAGIEDANLLLSNLRGKGGLASLEPIIGIDQVMKGRMSEEEYLRNQGHRGPHEYELSIPHPGENRDWLTKQIKEHKESGIDAEQLLLKQQRAHEQAFRRFEEKYPHKVKWLKAKMEKASEYANIRETTRSEFVRVYRTARAFALRAAEMTGMKDDIFFLYLHEITDLLAGKEPAVASIQARKQNYETYKKLPPFPSVINGRFNPFKWAEDPDRRADYYDAFMPAETDDAHTLKGFAGAAGRVEGIVRVLDAPEDGDSFAAGEILVTSTTNVGWTPLFPRAAAIITDVGAPLSHAAIVARELGIPAVVGCGNATSKLKTGDRVAVDGGQGIVQLEPRQTPATSEEENGKLIE
ncbi:PEP/pyruvate-binding domain-containing protein [Bacillus amyloliquefaciens]|uniref:PEP/pyruvate-binding domain-containing protein n=1 Tax=Bacillus amyloliquefaciens TaxID=1390 RepID=UPI000C78DB82|nr:PEP/pyruvate-binding domain-containing protein [Bacillus amyloliquefaciens]PLT49337.1 phosphoenolpyruvate synthase [Bacillus amyloliquefaciens]